MISDEDFTPTHGISLVDNAGFETDPINSQSQKYGFEDEDVQSDLETKPFDNKSLTGSIKEFLVTDNVPIEGITSVQRTIFNVVCSVVGSGLLQLPLSLSLTGWVGAPALIGFAIVATYTAILISKCMTPPNRGPLHSYAAIGNAALGRAGSIITEILVHIDCIGSSILYMILAGENLVILFTQIPTGDGTYYSLMNVNSTTGILLVAEILWFHIFLKTVHEIGVLSMFNILLALFLVGLVIVECLLDPLEPRPKSPWYSTNILAYGGSFTSMAFSYGCHSVLPTFREHMKNKNQYNLMIISSFTLITILYLSLAVVGFYTYGDQTQSPIYDNLCEDGVTCTFTEALGKYIAVFAVTIHVMACFVISLNPSEELMEIRLKVDQRQYAWLWRCVVRTVLFILMIIVSVSIPDFSDFLDLVSSLATSNVILLLPPIYYTILYWKEIPWWKVILHGCIIILAIYTAFFGCLFAVLSILCDVFSWQDACCLETKGKFC